MILKYKRVTQSGELVLGCKMREEDLVSEVFW